jgi:hypothetical protein
MIIPTPNQLQNRLTPIKFHVKNTPAYFQKK